MRSAASLACLQTFGGCVQQLRLTAACNSCVNFNCSSWQLQLLPVVSIVAQTALQETLLHEAAGRPYLHCHEFLSQQQKNTCTTSDSSWLYRRQHRCLRHKQQYAIAATGAAAKSWLHPRACVTTDSCCSCKPVLMLIRTTSASMVSVVSSVFLPCLDLHTCTACCLLPAAWHRR
jgi:hypothetical protein